MPNPWDCARSWYLNQNHVEKMGDRCPFPENALPKEDDLLIFDLVLLGLVRTKPEVLDPGVFI